MRATLAKHYPALNARERFVLMQAAQMRDDSAELHRLEEAAQRLNFSIADFTPFEDSWALMQASFMGDMMYECAAFWQAIYLRDDGEQLSSLLCALGYRTVILFDGWQRFCEGLQIPAPGSIGQYRGWPFVVDTVETARACAFTEAQMIGWLAERHELAYEQVRVTTAESVAASLASAYANLLRQWGHK